MSACLEPQSWLVLLAVGCAAWYVLRNTLKSADGKDCASGCGACASRTCTLRRLEAAQKKDSRPLDPGSR